MKMTAWTLIGLQFIDALGMGLLLPVMPFFIQELGASAIEVTLLVALYAFIGMLFSPLFGSMSDYFGRKPLILFSTVCTCAAYLCYLSAESMTYVFIVRAFHGAFAAKGGVVNAWLIDVVEPAERGRFLGLLGSMNGVGMLLGPVFASALVVYSGDIYETVFLGGALLSAIGALGIVLIGEGVVEVPTKPITKRRPLKYADLLVVNFAIFLGFSVVFAISAIYMQTQFKWSISDIGLAIGLMTGCVALVRAFVAHRFLSFTGLRRGTWAMASIMSLSLILTSCFAHPLLFMMFYCLTSSAYAIAAIGVTLLLAEKLTFETRGRGMGHLASASAAAIVCGALTHGLLFERFSPSAPFLIHGSLVFLAINIWYLSKPLNLLYQLLLSTAGNKS